MNLIMQTKPTWASAKLWPSGPKSWQRFQVEAAWDPRPWRETRSLAPGSQSSWQLHPRWISLQCIGTRGQDRRSSSAIFRIWDDGGVFGDAYLRHQGIFWLAKNSEDNNFGWRWWSSAFALESSWIYISESQLCPRTATHELQGLSPVHLRFISGSQEVIDTYQKPLWITEFAPQTIKQRRRKTEQMESRGGGRFHLPGAVFEIEGHKMT